MEIKAVGVTVNWGSGALGPPLPRVGTVISGSHIKWQQSNISRKQGPSLGLSTCLGCPNDVTASVN